jgi:hypothetical protein
VAITSWLRWRRVWLGLSDRGFLMCAHMCGGGSARQAGRHIETSTTLNDMKRRLKFKTFAALKLWCCSDGEPACLAQSSCHKCSSKPLRVGGKWDVYVSTVSRERRRAASQLCFSGQSMQHFMYHHSHDRHRLTVNGCCCWSGFSGTVDHANSVNTTI